MQAGKLKNKMIFQEPIITADSGGGSVTEWQEKTATWAEIEPLRGDRLFFAQQRDAGTDTQIRMRYGAAQIKPAWRIKYGADIYEIKSVINTKNADREIIINARMLESETIPAIIDAPAIISPDTAEPLPLNPVFIVSDFNMITGEDIQTQTRLQITLLNDNNFEGPIYDITLKADYTNPYLNNFIITDILGPATAYRIRARHIGSAAGASAWGQAVTYTTVALT